MATEISQKYQVLKDQINTHAVSCGRNPNQIKLVAVSKNRSIDDIRAVYNVGVRDFGENRVPEALDKISQFPSDVRWHFIGTLQKNKVRKVVGNFALIHSVDSLDLAAKISDVSVDLGVKTKILLQANTSGELSKHGLGPSEWHKVIEEIAIYPNIEICGLMTMAPLTDDEFVVRQCFAKLRQLRDDLQKVVGGTHLLNELSMGMSQDYGIAIEEGATMIRVGTAIFG